MAQPQSIVFAVLCTHAKAATNQKPEQTKKTREIKASKTNWYNQKQREYV
jgi:hypothetical protein